jgi:zinc protease
VHPPAARLSSEARLLLEDRVELPRVYISWHTPGLFQPDDAEMDLLADVLTSGKSSRLYRSLVYEQRIATEVAAIQNSREAAGFFQVIATAAPGRTLQDLLAAIDVELAKIRTEAPTSDELERAKVQFEAQFVFGLQNVGGFGGKSDQLNAYNVFLSDPGYFTRDFDRYQDATADQLRDVARRYLRSQQRVALSVVPAGRADLGLAASSPVAPA